MKSLIVLWLLFGIGTMLAAGGYCWKIKEMDMRYYCEAKAEGKKSCWKIKNEDKRAFCESVAEGKRNCWKIHNADEKNLCEALVE